MGVKKEGNNESTPSARRSLRDESGRGGARDAVRCRSGAVPERCGGASAVRAGPFPSLLFPSRRNAGSRGRAWGSRGALPCGEPGGQGGSGPPERAARGEPRGPVGTAPPPGPRLNVCVCVSLPPLRPCREGGGGARGEDGERQAKESAQTADYLFQLSAGGVAEEVPEDPIPRPARAGRAGRLAGTHADAGTRLGALRAGPGRVGGGVPQRSPLPAPGPDRVDFPSLSPPLAGENLVPEQKVQDQEDHEERGDAPGAQPQLQRPHGLQLPAVAGGVGTSGLVALPRPPRARAPARRQPVPRQLPGEPLGLVPRRQPPRLPPAAPRLPTASLGAALRDDLLRAEPSCFFCIPLPGLLCFTVKEE